MFHSSTHTDSSRPSTTATAIPDRPRPRQGVLGKRPLQGLLTADLLAADERIHRNRDGAIDVSVAAVFGQAHFGKGLACAQDRFEMADLHYQMSVHL